MAPSAAPGASLRAQMLAAMGAPGGGREENVRAASIPRRARRRRFAARRLRDRAERTRRAAAHAGPAHLARDPDHRDPDPVLRRL